MNTRNIVIGSLLAAIAALFQLMPFFFSEMLIFMTIFSAVPIYIASRINPKIGVLSYFVTSVIVMTLSVHESLFFLLTNGIVGMSLGICNYYIDRKSIIWSISSIPLTIALSIMNFGIGIPIFGTQIPGGIIIQLLIILLISAIYNIFYYYFSSFIYELIIKKTCNHFDYKD